VSPVSTWCCLPCQARPTGELSAVTPELSRTELSAVTPELSRTPELSCLPCKVRPTGELSAVTPELSCLPCKVRLCALRELAVGEG